MIKCYCDASFSPETKNAICGWKIGEDNAMQTMLLINTNNTRAEIIGLIHLIHLVNKLPNNSTYIIYTDCLSVIDRIKKRGKLQNKNFCNRKGQSLANADIYQELFSILKENIKIIHIDGHLPKNKRNNDNKIFSEIDIAVRRKLRAQSKY